MTYAATIRNTDNGTGYLSDDQLRAMAPTVFADQPHSSRSARYAYIPTAEIVNNLRGEGFMPVKVQVSRVRPPKDGAESKEGYQKHMLRFRHISTLQKAADTTLQRAVGDLLPEIVLVNAHDGSSRYKLFGGLFRLVCLNGMVVAESLIEAVNVKHSGNEAQIIQDVIAGSYNVLENTGKAMEVASNWRQLQLNPVEQTALATAAHFVRFADSDGNIDTPIAPRQLLRARRSADTGNDLWTTFNRVQENVIKGGISAVGLGSNGRPRTTTMRQVNNIDGDVRTNRALWVLAEALASAKSTNAVDPAAQLMAALAESN